MFLDPKNGMRAHSPKPPLYKTALLFPLDRSQHMILVLARQGAAPVKISTANNFPRRYQRVPQIIISTGAKFW